MGCSLDVQEEHYQEWRMRVHRRRERGVDTEVLEGRQGMMEQEGTLAG